MDDPLLVFDPLGGGEAVQAHQDLSKEDPSGLPRFRGQPQGPSRSIDLTELMPLRPQGDKALGQQKDLICTVAELLRTCQHSIHNGGYTRCCNPVIDYAV